MSFPHGADGALFTGTAKVEARKRLGLDPSLPLVLAVGRLMQIKGFSNLIRSIELLDDESTQLSVIRRRARSVSTLKVASRLTARQHQTYR